LALDLKNKLTFFDFQASVTAFGQTRFRSDENLKKRTKNKKKCTFGPPVGYNFKSELVFYTVPTNDNGKMSGQAYVDSILEPVVKK